MTTKNRRPPKSTLAQPSFDSLPTAEPASYIVWETKTVNLGRGDTAETWDFYETVCKGHWFRVGLLPKEILTAWPEPPPSQWTGCRWEMNAQFELSRPELEFMSSLPFCETKQEALALAEERIRGFINQQRRQYA